MTSTPWQTAWRSPDTLLPLLRERAPQWAAGLAGLAVGVQLALILTGLFRGEPPVGAAFTPAPPGGTAARAPLDIAAILNAKLFGTAASQAAGDPSDAPPTSMPIVLAGVLADPDPQRGFAIIGESAAAAKLRRVGEALPGGATLHAIYGDRVIISRGGALESVTLPRQLSSTPLVSNLPPVGGEAGAAVDRMRSLVQRDPGLIGDLMRPTKVFDKGQLRGYRVYPGRNPAAFSRLGLRPGDLITSINGTPLDDPSRGDEIMRTMGSAAEVRVSLIRNGRPSDLNLNLAEVASQAEQVVNSPGITPVEETPAMLAPTPQ
jgi:general secretion pathway protein C